MAEGTQAMQDTQTPAPRGGIQVIERAARILRALKHDSSGMSLGQIAEAVDLPRSTVQRIVGALLAEGLVMTGPRGRRLWLGPEITELAGRSRRDVVEACRLVLTELSQDTGETADLAVLRDDAMIFLDQIPGVHRLRAVSSVGDAFPLTTTANGLACLAMLGQDEALKLARAERERRGAAFDRKAFAARLAAIRASGLAYDRDEHTAGISAVGIAFRDWSGNLHSISVPIPSSRFPSVRKTVEVSLGKAKAHAETLMAKG